MSHVLIVEDNAGIGWVLREVLSSEGHEVTLELNADAALGRLRTDAPPDLLLTDLVMRGLSGRDLVHAMADDPRLCAVPVIVITAATNPEVFPRPGSYQAVLRKPFDLEDMLQTVERLTGPARAEDG